jgi:hypothetical protein
MRVRAIRTARTHRGTAISGRARKLSRPARVSVHLNAEF